MNELEKRIKSFGYAFKGIASLLKKEHNAWIHCLAIVVVTSLGFYFHITSTEWCIVLLCFGMVLAAEGFDDALADHAAVFVIGFRQHDNVLLSLIHI